MRNKIVAGNWKMNTNFHEAEELVNGIVQKMNENELGNVDVVLCPPFPFLHQTKRIINGTSNLFLGAQNCHWELKGAYTGEVSAPMLRSLDVDYVILGHSERRQYFKENNAIIARKMQLALSNNLKVIYCVGETLIERKNGNHENVVGKQIKDTLGGLNVANAENVIIAYEPVWAIGTGETATSEQAESMHSFIRESYSDLKGKSIASKTSIIYGGSCNPNNANDLFSGDNIDGGLIGGASLNEDGFISIIKALN